MNKIKKVVMLLLLGTSIISACEKNEDVEPADAKTPTIENMEIGLNNSGIGVIERDFHFEADVVAGGRIDVVTLKILQKAGETYSKTWKHEIVWTAYKGAKNTNIHKHFLIPADAAEGKYDFLIIVQDENGTKLEVKKEVQIYAASNMPAEPQLSIFSIFKNSEFAYRYKPGATAVGLSFKNGDTIQSQVTISNVKGDGQLFLLLINKKHKHQPETIKDIDLSKVTVYDKLEHKAEANIFDFSNVIFDETTFTFKRDMPVLILADRNQLEPGDYNFLILYENSSAKLTLSQSTDFKVN